MLPIPDAILKRFDAILEKRDVTPALRADFKKWLRYFLDFCAKYPPPAARSDQVCLFIDKLREKRQTLDQQKQAAYAVSLYFELQQAQVMPPSSPPAMSPLTIAAPGSALRQHRRLWEEGYAVKSDSPEWDMSIAKLASEIKTRRYSRKTLKTYAHWSRQFQRFLRNKPPHELSSVDVREYLTYLAVQCRVSASTQNQAFNAPLFLFRHVLKQDFGDHKDVPRAKNQDISPWSFPERS
jgi:hypothetical protein